MQIKHTEVNRKIWRKTTWTNFEQTRTTALRWMSYISHSFKNSLKWYIPWGSGTRPWGTPHVSPWTRWPAHFIMPLTTGTRIIPPRAWGPVARPVISPTPWRKRPGNGPRMPWGLLVWPIVSLITRWNWSWGRSRSAWRVIIIPCPAVPASVNKKRKQTNQLG